jgi:hypothetical protein
MRRSRGLGDVYKRQRLGGGSGAGGAGGNGGAGKNPDDDRVVLKFKCADGEAKIRIGPLEPLAKAFNVFRDHAIKQGWPKPPKAGAGGAQQQPQQQPPAPDKAKWSFVYDGEALQSTQTAGGVGMEKGDVIDAILK